MLFTIIIWVKPPPSTREQEVCLSICLCLLCTIVTNVVESNNYHDCRLCPLNVLHFCSNYY